MVELDTLLGEYGLDGMGNKAASMFPQNPSLMDDVFHVLLRGDVTGLADLIFDEGAKRIWAPVAAMKEMFLWLVLAGVLSVLVYRFGEVFGDGQVAKLCGYFVSLTLCMSLFRGYEEAGEIAMGAMRDLILFARLLIPTFFSIVGIATGPLSAGAGTSFLMLLIYGVEEILLKVAVPLLEGYVILALMDGILGEDRLKLLMELIRKIIEWGLRVSVGGVIGMGVIQTSVLPLVDTTGIRSARRLVSTIPGVGNALGSAAELMLGSALLLKNSVGTVLLVLLILLCLEPVLKLLSLAMLYKAVAAIYAIVSLPRMLSTTDTVGDAMLLLLKCVVTGMLFFFVLLAFSIMGLGL